MVGVTGFAMFLQSQFGCACGDRENARFWPLPSFGRKAGSPESRCLRASGFWPQSRADNIPFRSRYRASRRNLACGSLSIDAIPGAKVAQSRIVGERRQGMRS